MKRYQKILLGSILGIVILMGGIQIYFSFFLDRQLKQTMVNRFHDATNDAYNLNIGDFDLELLGRQLTISDVAVAKKSDSTNTDIHITLDRLAISGIEFTNFFFNQELSLQQIQLINPAILITTSPQESESEQPAQWNSLSHQLSDIALQVLDQITIPILSIRGLSVNYNRSDLPVNPYLAFRNSDIHLYDISIDSASLTGDRIIPSDNITTAFRDIHYQTKDGMYDVSADQLAFSSLDGKMSINSLELQPRFDKDTFADKFNHEIDRISLEIEEINTRDINTQQLNRAKGLTAQRITLSNPDVDIYRDKRPPFPPNNRPPLPQQMIRNVPFPINIDSLTLSDGNIRYSERVPKAEESGHITFTNLFATLKNLTNIEEQWSNTTPTLTAKTNIMDAAELNAQFRFPMDSQKQHISGSLTAMQMQPLNQALVPLAFVRIDDGQILGMDFEMDLSEHHASGNMTFQYQNLNISLLDKEKNEQTFGNKMKSLLANTFKVKSDNTGDNPRTATIDFEREINKSVFNYWWKSLLSGLKSSIGL